MITARQLKKLSDLRWQALHLARTLQRKSADRRYRQCSRERYAKVARKAQARFQKIESKYQTTRAAFLAQYGNENE